MTHVFNLNETYVRTTVCVASGVQSTEGLRGARPRQCAL